MNIAIKLNISIHKRSKTLFSVNSMTKMGFYFILFGGGGGVQGTDWPDESV